MIGMKQERWDCEDKARRKHGDERSKGFEMMLQEKQFFTKLTIKKEMERITRTKRGQR